MDANGKKRGLVAGCGSMAQHWIRMIRDNPRTAVAGLMDIRLDAARESARANGLDVPVFDRLDAALAAVRPDFVADITVPAAHCATTVAALEAGCAVVGEKPMAEGMDEARRMVAASEKAGRLYMVSQNYRYSPANYAMRGCVARGDIGEVTAVNCDFYIGAHFGGFRDAMASPLILDMAIHHYDLCRFYTGLDARRVFALEFNPKGSWYRGDVAATVIFEMAGGAVFTYRGSWCAEGLPTGWGGEWRVQGVRGCLAMRDGQPPRGQRVAEGAQPGFTLALEEVAPAPPELSPGGIELSYQLFVDALHGGPKPPTECHDNIKSLAMVQSAIRSSREKRWVEVEA